MLDRIYFALSKLSKAHIQQFTVIKKWIRLWWIYEFAGDLTLGETPHPIPNCEVKP